jgi:hypothetical protein
VRQAGEALIENYPPHLPQSARFPGILRAYGAFFSGGFDRLYALMDETVEACRTHGRTWELAYSLQLRAKVNNDVSERMDASVRDIAEGRRLFQQLGDEWGMAETLSAEAEAAGNAGDWLRAAECCREGIALARKIGSNQHVPVLVVRLGDALINSGDPEEGERTLREGIEDAERFGVTGNGAGFIGRIMLANQLSHRNDPREALELIEETIQRQYVSEAMPGFVIGMLLALKGYLIGKAGDPRTGMEILAGGVETLADHPLADVITPRLAVVLMPGAAVLLRMLAESNAVDEVPDVRRLHRAVLLVGAHDRWRPSAMPPADRRELDEGVERLRALMGDEDYEAAYAEGGALSVGEAVALMRDVV